MSQAARLALEDLLVARGRLARLMRLHRQGRAFARGKPVPLLVAHRARVTDLETAYQAAGGEAALAPDAAASARTIARRRLDGDMHAGKCLCERRDCGHSLKGLTPRG